MAHALLSPSAAHRWLNCTAAPLLEKDVKDNGSTFAEEGSLAHAIAAKKLKTFLKLDTSEEDKEIAELKDKYYCGEMEEYTDAYVSIVLEKFNAAKQRTKDAKLLVEVRLDFSHYVPEAFGTSDVVIIADDLMEVIDLKYGKGVKVSAIENPQMKIYALGAYDAFSFDYKIENIRMTIIQPRIDNLSEYEMTIQDLVNWTVDVLQPKAKEAFSGNGRQMPGKWCQFCKVNGRCRALAEQCTGIVKKHPDPTLIKPEDMAEHVLPLIPVVKTWLSSVEEYTLEQALAGTQYVGYKLVVGRSIRKITDADAVIDLLEKAGYAKDMITKPTELKSITDLEKLVGKKKFSTLCADHIFKPDGKPTLVPDEDKRQALNPMVDDFKDVNIE